MRRPTGGAGITLVSLKRRRSSARNDAGRSAICLSSNRHDRGNEQQTSGVARLAGRRAVSARGGIKIEIIDAELRDCRASFETRLFGAPQDEASIDMIYKNPSS